MHESQLRLSGESSTTFELFRGLGERNHHLEHLEL